MGSYICKECGQRSGDAIPFCDHCGARSYPEWVDWWILLPATMVAMLCCAGLQLVGVMWVLRWLTGHPADWVEVVVLFAIAVPIAIVIEVVKARKRKRE